jgi:hypothetical protein
LAGLCGLSGEGAGEVLSGTGLAHVVHLGVELRAEDNVPMGGQTHIMALRDPWVAEPPNQTKAAETDPGMLQRRLGIVPTGPGRIPFS